MRLDVGIATIFVTLRNNKESVKQQISLISNYRANRSYQYLDLNKVLSVRENSFLGR